MSDNVIETRAITRYFGSKCAVDQLTLSVPRGSVFALLGRNGSGKSTLMRMLLGYLDPTRGSATVLGEDCQKLTPKTRGRVGYIAEGHPLIDWMRVRDLESFQKSYYSNWDAKMFAAVVEQFDLGPTARAGEISRGQRAGLSLALVLATRPELLIMDDPSIGLDPVARRTLLEAMILVTRNAGHTIFFSSHVLEDVERVADHVAILDRSILRVASSIETFRARVKRFVLTFAGEPPEISGIPGILQIRRDGHDVQLTLANVSEQTEAKINSIGQISIREIPLTFEDAVISYLGTREYQGSLLQRTQEAGVA